MRDTNPKTKIFLDSGDPNETKAIINMLGFLDGQTTNPTLIAKHPYAKKRLQKGKKFTREEIFSFYKSVVREISSLIPQGSVSIEVYADSKTNNTQMYEQGKEMFGWVSNAHIKYPTTHEGLIAAEKSIKEKIRVNMTLCFSQEQAAAVYSATRTGLVTQTLSGFHNVFVSPFIGRLDDRGEKGMDLIKDIVQMYQSGDRHVGVLAASVRNIEHFMYALHLGADMITAPFKILEEWASKGKQIISTEFAYDSSLKAIPYQNINLSRPWQEYRIGHELTDIGIEKFSSDWNALVTK